MTNDSNAQAVRRDENRVQAGRSWNWIVLLPVIAIAWATFQTLSVGTDPTAEPFKEWLAVGAATNPVPFHAPFRDGAALIYLADEETPVKAAMSGTLTVVSQHSVTLSAAGIVVTYEGFLHKYTGPAEVECGETMGSFSPHDSGPGVLHVHVTRNGKLLHPIPELQTRIRPEKLKKPF